MQNCFYWIFMFPMWISFIFRALILGIDNSTHEKKVAHTRTNRICLIRVFIFTCCNDNNCKFYSVKCKRVANIHGLTNKQQTLNIGHILVEHIQWSLSNWFSCAPLNCNLKNGFHHTHTHTHTRNYDNFAWKKVSASNHYIWCGLCGVSTMWKCSQNFALL